MRELCLSQVLVSSINSIWLATTPTCPSVVSTPPAFLGLLPSTSISLFIPPTRTSSPPVPSFASETPPPPSHPPVLLSIAALTHPILVVYTSSTSTIDISNRKHASAKRWSFSHWSRTVLNLQQTVWLWGVVELDLEVVHRWVRDAVLLDS